MESLGAHFKRERERQKISLDEVAAATKIGSRMLKALEEDHFDQLPGGIFNKGFVRAYARHLGMDEEQAIADYLAATGAVQSIKEPETVLTALAVRAEESRSAEPGSADGIPWDKIAAVLLLIAFGFALWGWRTRKQNHAETHAGTPAQTQPQPQQQQQQQEKDQPTDPAAPASAPGSVAPAPPSVSATSTSAAAPAESASPAGTLLLLIRARVNCWVDVTADGKPVTHELLPAGAQKSVEAQREIVVKAGNIGGLEFTFNGKKLPSQGASDEVKTLKFDSSGLQAPVAGVHLSPNAA